MTAAYGYCSSTTNNNALKRINNPIRPRSVVAMVQYDLLSSGFVSTPFTVLVVRGVLASRMAMHVHSPLAASHFLTNPKALL